MSLARSVISRSTRRYSLSTDATSSSASRSKSPVGVKRPPSSSLRTINPSVEEAAEGLGAGPWRRFFGVTLPLVFPAVSAGALLTFVLSLADFGTPAIVGGKVRKYYAITDEGRRALAETRGKIAELVGEHHTTLVFVNTRRLAERLAGRSPSPIHYDNIPSCTYCQPQVASVLRCISV